MDDSDTPGTPDWWIKRLNYELTLRRNGLGLHAWNLRKDRRKHHRPGLDLLDDYLAGDPPLPYVAKGWADAMRPFLRQARLNVADLVVECVRERMVPQGWTTSEDSDEDGDQIAADIAHANDLELQLTDLFGWGLALGDSYLILGKETDAADDAIPLITVEDPRHCITAEDPATRKTLAALKVYRDEWAGDDVSVLYTPGWVHVARNNTTSTGNWAWDEPRKWPAGFEDFLPVYRFQNRRGVGEFEPHLDVLDRINDQIFTRVAIGKYQAFRQRAARNLPSHDDQTGEEIDYSAIFVADPGAMWQVPDGVEFWESQTVDLGPIRLATKDDIEHLAAVTRTPMYFITPDAASGSAEGASTQREGLLYRAEDRRRRADSTLAKAFAGAFRMMGQEGRARGKIETLWQPAERFSLGERASAASQARAGGLPTRRIWRDIWQYRPDEIPALQREEAEDLRREAERAELLELTRDPSPRPRPAPTADPTSEPAE